MVRRGIWIAEGVVRQMIFIVIFSLKLEVGELSDSGIMR
jgi:hypothetical protein